LCSEELYHPWRPLSLTVIVPVFAAALGRTDNPVKIATARKYRFISRLLYRVVNDEGGSLPIEIDRCNKIEVF
jgi:hypothetical protein